MMRQKWKAIDSQMAKESLDGVFLINLGAYAYIDQNEARPIFRSFFIGGSAIN
jgi:hypothetical protein